MVTRFRNNLNLYLSSPSVKPAAAGAVRLKSMFNPSYDEMVEINTVLSGKGLESDIA